jgi:hypothetical protein
VDETILSTFQVSLVFHRESRIVHHEFRQPVFGRQFRKVLLSGLEVMRMTGATKWLSDDRGNSALSEREVDWADNVWFPAMKAAGWKHWAVVMPASQIGQINVQTWAAKFRELGVNAMAFDDPESAMTWLEAQE